MTRLLLFHNLVYGQGIQCSSCHQIMKMKTVRLFCPIGARQSYPEYTSLPLTEGTRIWSRTRSGPSLAPSRTYIFENSHISKLNQNMWQVCKLFKTLYLNGKLVSPLGLSDIKLFTKLFQRGNRVYFHFDNSIFCRGELRVCITKNFIVC